MKNERFTEVYKRYNRLIIKIAYDSLKDGFAAEEICQQVFVSFYENMEKISEEHMKGWLIVAAKNALIDYVRKQKSRSGKVFWLYGVEESLTTEDNAEHVVERVMQSQLSFQILQDLRKKNQEWYEIVMAICVYGRRLGDAAKHLQMTPQVLSAKLYRAKKYIRDKYQREYHQN